MVGPGFTCYYSCSKTCAPFWRCRCKKSDVMQLTQSLGMRPELRQILTPRMIQSMEILQLPMQKLEERIEQELQNNPVLELSPGETDLENIPDSANGEAQAERDARSEGERTLVVKEG